MAIETELSDRSCSFSPVIKVVSAGCNLRCRYCFYSGNQPEIKVMPDGVLKKVTGECLKYGRNIRFIWHGGEPTIVGPDYYREVIRVQNELKTPEQTISNSIQTNATLIDDEWIAFLKESNWGIGVSIDGPDWLHNLARLNAAGRGSYTQVLEGINRLKEANIKFGAIAVVNKVSVNQPQELFDFMYELGIPFSVNPCSARPEDLQELKDLALTQEDYTSFLMKLFDLWVEKDDPAFRIRPLVDIVEGLMGGQPSLCKFKGECQKYITIDSNGDVYPCDEFLEERYKLGNLTSQPLEDLLISQHMLNYYSGRKLLDNVCRPCEWYSICKGGCMRDWDGKKNIPDPKNESFCRSRDLLFSTISQKLAGYGYGKEVN